MKTKTILFLALGGLAVYFLFLAPKQQARPQASLSNLPGDLARVIGDFGGGAA